MGSWGPGLQANDDALDALYHFRTRLEGISRTKKARVRRKKAEAIFAEMKADERYSDAFSILGVADKLLGCKTDLKGIKPIEDALKAEKTKDRLAGWREPKDRVRALGNFERRLNKLKVPAIDLALDNAGLFCRMGQSNDELRKRIKT